MVFDLNEYRRKPRTVVSLESQMPPQDIELEQEVLAGLLFDQNAIQRVADILTPDAFYLNAHQEVYRAAISLYRADSPVDLFMVASWLEKQGLLEKVGGKKMLVELPEVYAAVNIDRHALMLVELHRRRRMISLCQELTSMAFDPMVSAADLQKTAEQQIFSFSDASSRAGLRPIGDYLTELYESIERLASTGERQLGIPTGFYDLDTMISGLQKQKLIIAAGRPSMGKSAFAAAIARNVADQGHSVALFSLEMTGGEIGLRLLSSESAIDSGRIATGQIVDYEWTAIAQSMQTLSESGIFIDESLAIDPHTIATRCRQLKAQSGLGLVIVDYLHLMLDGGDDEVREIGKITRQLKKIARELDVPVLVLSQLNRSIENQSDKRPHMSHLRQSGSIEQDADIILMLYRDEYYNPDTPDIGIAEVLIRKNRGGPIGTVKLLFEPQFSRFKNLARSNP